MKAKELIDGEGNPSLHLRVFVTGGGCSGFQYGFSFDEESQEDDTEIVKDGVKVVVDGMSYQYLVGSTVDLFRVTDWIAVCCRESECV